MKELNENLASVAAELTKTYLELKYKGDNNLAPITKIELEKEITQRFLNIWSSISHPDQNE